MTVEIGGHLLLAPASIAATAVAVALSLVLVRLAQQTAARVLFGPLRLWLAIRQMVA